MSAKPFLWFSACKLILLCDAKPHSAVRQTQRKSCNIQDGCSFFRPQRVPARSIVRPKTKIHVLGGQATRFFDPIAVPTTASLAERRVGFGTGRSTCQELTRSADVAALFSWQPADINRTKLSPVPTHTHCEQTTSTDRQERRQRCAFSRLSNAAAGVLYTLEV